MATEVKTPTQINPRVRQGRAGLKIKEMTPTPPQPNKPAQVTNKPILHKPESTAQP